MKAITGLVLLTLSATCANAAQLVLPSVVITAPAVSQTPVCTQAAASKLVVPMRLQQEKPAALAALSLCRLKATASRAGIL